MEVLGAVASSIAVVQALAAGKHVVSIIREVPDIQDDFNYLMKELSLINSMVKAVSRKPPSAYEQALMDAAAEDLSEVTKELGELLRSCVREVNTKDGKICKTRKRKWLLEKSTITKLQQRMTNAKTTLHFAVTSSHATNDAQFQAYMRQMLMNLYAIHPVQNDTTETLSLKEPEKDQQTDSSESSALEAITTSSQKDNARLLEMDSSMWNYQKDSIQEIRQSVVDYVVYPCDADFTGVGLIEYAIIESRYIALETLLDLWENVLPEVELPKRIADHANDRLSWGNLHDHEIYLLQKLVRLIGHPSRETTNIHIAIRRREGLQAALQEQPWAINTVDYTGHCPLTLATDRDQIDCMEMLISAGANVNEVTPQGKSALMLAAQRGTPESVRLLLNAKCRVDWADMDGETALHKASWCQCIESVSLLLAAGASATCQNFFGETSLHRLTSSTTNNNGDAKRIIEMLVLAGTDLEARDLYGSTPVLNSLEPVNISVLAYLLDLGCSLSLSNSRNRNILHLAAMYASLEMLEYLGSLGLHVINPYQKDLWGSTPRDWILDIYDGKYFGTRTPSSAELSAFFNLCQGIKNRSLQHDIGNIEKVVAGLQDRDAATAREHLGSLLAKEELWKREGLVCWYRAVDKRVQNLEWDLATEDLSDYLTELKEEVDTPVYDIPSRYGCTFSDSQIWEITASVSEIVE
ncbi:uncharacterized protein FIESC28_00049 [Fusarium coffeatum]|uniref:Uncharacterized protein n=1 Tax=Fusarium coffeatum TaxID=231269 RepID=A0A366SET9_9HYPO|nr:uncharacterized protein FIESC28_00049 [Fusarium coffeatum]RBR27186.1 hypothetical protein FIESC28_00049 [Fusarium coffeatum]